VLSFSVGMQVAITVTTGLVGFACIAVMLRRLPWNTRVPTPDPGAHPVEP
jgi:hypothetical protein